MLIKPLPGAFAPSEGDLESLKRGQKVADGINRIVNKNGLTSVMKAYALNRGMVMVMLNESATDEHSNRVIELLKANGAVEQEKRNILAIHEVRIIVDKPAKRQLIM